MQQEKNVPSTSKCKGRTMRTYMRTWTGSSLLPVSTGRATCSSINKGTPYKAGVQRAKSHADQTEGSPGEHMPPQQPPAPLPNCSATSSRHLTVPFVLTPNLPQAQEIPARKPMGVDPQEMIKRLQELRKEASQHFGDAPQGEGTTSTQRPDAQGPCTPHPQEVEQDGVGGQGLQWHGTATRSTVMQRLAHAEVQPPLREGAAKGHRKALGAGQLGGRTSCTPQSVHADAAYGGAVVGMGKGWLRGGISSKLERLRQLQQEGESMLFEAGHQ